MSSAANTNCSREEYKFPRSRRRSFAIFSVDTTTLFCEPIVKRKIGPYSSAHCLNKSHECLGGIWSRLPSKGSPKINDGAFENTWRTRGLHEVLRMSGAGQPKEA